MSSRLLAAALLGVSALALSVPPADAASRLSAPAIGEESVTLTPAREASEGPRREDRRSSEAPADLQLLLAREASEGPRREDRRQDRRNDRRNDRREDRRGAALDTMDDGFIMLVREGSSGGGRQRRNGGRTGR
ncbi:hypothetical protein DFH01_18955 [Falsiroseomonas bella]|uniref:Uncharacterized protein n=1 Tax=Falsiroseomonas bella TaxID=2184016 RepID=A0A317F946_9PROT|nr:hypothetical protein [Falsiroseomonas bella]PWS35671.1 hypothetical protein DFH01_18955 [Falsiroseomonas bella]